MELKLHRNARTTPRIREEINASKLTMRELSVKYNVSLDTIHKWKHRTSSQDAPNIKRNLGQSTSLEEELLIVNLRKDLKLSLNDIQQVINSSVNANLSRSSIYRCLKRYGVNKFPKESPKAYGKFSNADKCGFIHIDLKQLTKLHKRGSYVFVAIDRATRYVYAEIIYDKSSATVGECLKRFLNHFPHKVYTILTDNGKEFTNRSCINSAKTHIFDSICQENKIEHRLTKPYHPQTNGMVERFNRRLAEILRQKDEVPERRKNKFLTHEERNEYIMNFVDNYNRTKLHCLNYKAPNEMLNNFTELYNSANLRLSPQCS
jgi:transposase